MTAQYKEEIFTLHSTTFFNNLPHKTCVDCGHDIEEQHESYLFHCEKCLENGK